ncbi:MAG: hypothetical protein LBH16_01405 [Treponema sp.]|jgi:hypothetical protein|nr:hypothetical protein [Treponema sp.]
MAKNSNAIYAPGELSRVRDKLGVTNDAEAKRMAQLLGGEVGTERNTEPKNPRKETVELSVGKGGKRRRIDMSGMDDDGNDLLGIVKNKGPYPGDDPAKPLRLGYFERIKMDQYAGQAIFDIKNSIQVLTSLFSFFRTPVDYISSVFVVKRMNDYFNKIEQLVFAARHLFPKTNKKRDNQLKRASPFVYKAFDAIRSWNIEGIASSLSILQARPRNVKSDDFTQILKEVYRPLFIIEGLSADDLKSVFKLIYKILYIESPMEAKEKYQDAIRSITASISSVRREIQFGMYPLLMKLISDRFISYERFFIERRNRYMAFLNITESEQLNASDMNPQLIENMDVEALVQNTEEEEENSPETQEEEILSEEEEDPNDPKTAERKAKEEAEKAEQKALEQGRSSLETIYPKAGWDKLDEYPDMYPYFSGIYNLRHGYELIAPGDPLMQVAVLMHILEDLFIAVRYVNFGSIAGPDGNLVRIIDELGEIINNWRSYISESFDKEYLPRLSDYCRMLENSQDARSSIYAKKTLNELHWIKRLYFLPYYKFESMGPPTFQKKDVIPIYSQVRKLRKYITSVAMGIEQGVRAGGAQARIQCNGIHNPWESYNFQVPNPISKRLNIMLPPEKRMNATLVFFTLSAVAVLDHIVNDENSWSYGNRPGPLFRSIKNEGIVPLFGVDEKVDADQIFKEALRKKQ